MAVRPIQVDEIYGGEEQTVGEGQVWMPEPEAFEDFSTLEIAEATPSIPVSVTPSQFTEFAFRMPKDDGTGYAPFSFKGRRHMIRPYDTQAKRVLLFSARQIEKCSDLTCGVTLANGMPLMAKDIRVGQRVACLDTQTGFHTKMTTARVVAVSEVIQKPGVRIKTRQGHILDVAATHPVRVWENWKEAGELKVGDRVAAVRKAGEFGTAHVVPERVELLAFMLGNGGTTVLSKYTYSGGTRLSTDRFLECCARIGTRAVLDKPGTAQYRLNVSQLNTWTKEDGLDGKYSYQKTIPAWVFDLDREQSALFLNRLWSTDGHVSQRTKSLYELVYCSTSRELARQVQALLWKFGIPSNIRENQPSYVCTNGDPARLAYLLRVETQDGVRTFLNEVGAIGKSEGIALPTCEENNNRDTCPIEINTLIAAITHSRGRLSVERVRSKPSLFSAGLRRTPEYALTRGKLQRYVDFFRSDSRFDQRLVDKLEAQLHTDLYWDEIESIEILGTIDCVDMQVEQHNNFLIDGVVTHNSTLLGNKAIAYCCMVTGYRVLYVSPSATQTKTFSVDRVKDPLETSEVLRSFMSGALQQNVFEKQFVNRSKITLRYAFLNADRCRGIPTYGLFLDELQDIISDNIPIIEQCTSHAPEQWKRYVYSGTPKSLDNVIEYYWSGSSKSGRPMSTMGEWVVPCSRHGGEGGRYWNILGEKNIGKTGLICEKCGKRIDPMHEDAQWASQFEDGIYEAYRIPQLMVPWRSWEEILLDYGRYSRDKFYNEVLGISYDSGLRPLTRTQVKANCVDSVRMSQEALEWYKGHSTGTPCFAGLDWGSGENSYTVLSLGTYVNPTRFRIFYIHRFQGEETDPEVQLSLIVELLKYYNVKVIGADYGGGHYPNDRLVRTFGPSRVQKYQYVGKSRKKIFFSKEHRRWMVNRTDTMSDIFNAIKRKQFEFPRWAEFNEPFAKDMLNIFSEYNQSLRMIQYGHKPDRPDDSFHSILYCFLASMLLIPRPDIIAPNKEDPKKGPQRSSWSGDLDQG